MGYQTNDRPWGPRWEMMKPHVPAAGKTALDIGASEGFFSRELVKMGYQVHAVEKQTPDPKIKGITWHPDLADADYIASAARRFRIPGGKFDLVLGMSVLHHFPDWGAAYWAMRSVGKACLIEVPNPDETRAGRSKLDGKLPSLSALVGGEVIGTAPGWKSEYPRNIAKVLGGYPHGIPSFVVSGNQIATRNVPKFDAKLFGYVPEPGTLNIVTTKAVNLTGPPSITLPSARGEYRLWPAKINGVPCHIYRPPQATSWRRIELVAPVCLRSVLAIEDGDAVFLDITT